MRAVKGRPPAPLQDRLAAMVTRVWPGADWPSYQEITCTIRQASGASQRAMRPGMKMLATVWVSSSSLTLPAKTPCAAGAQSVVSCSRNAARVKSPATSICHQVRGEPHGVAIIWQLDREPEPLNGWNCRRRAEQDWRWCAIPDS